MLRAFAIVLTIMGLAPIITSCGGGGTDASAAPPKAEPNQQAASRQATATGDPQILRIISNVLEAQVRVEQVHILGQRYTYADGTEAKLSGVLVMLELEVISNKDGTQRLIPSDLFLASTSSVAGCNPCRNLTSVATDENKKRDLTLTIPRYGRGRMFFAWEVPASAMGDLVLYAVGGDRNLPIDTGFPPK